MKKPGFWAWEQGGILATVLSPVGKLYGLATALRLRFKKTSTCGLPVICVGNLVAGGTGKTPVVMDLAARLRNRNNSVHILSRGYGGTEKGPLCVSPDRHDAGLLGDEALLLCRAAPTWVARDRAAGCRRAVTEGASVILMDDGFQDPSCARDLSLVVVDGAFGFGNGRMIPAGPLREPVASGLKRADAVIVLGHDRTGVKPLVAAACTALPVLCGRLEPGTEGKALYGCNLLAFAGIGNPDKFFDTLRTCQPETLTTRAFPDHHYFSRDEVQRLRQQADALKAVLITTEKDMVRIPPDLATGIETLSVHVVWDNADEIDQLLETVTEDAT